MLMPVNMYSYVLTLCAEYIKLCILFVQKKKNERLCCDCVAVAAQLNPARPPLLSLFLERPEHLALLTTFYPEESWNQQGPD